MPTTIEKQPKLLESNLDANMEYLNELLGVKESFDMICRRLRYAGKDFALYFIHSINHRGEASEQY